MRVSSLSSLRASHHVGATALCLAAGLFALPAHANLNGSTIGRSGRGCGSTGSCHGQNPGATAVLMGPMTVAPGSRTTYTLVINSTLAGFMGGGCDISATGASLAVNPAQMSTHINGGELVHTAMIPRAAGGPVSIQFDVFAPSTPGTLSLSAAGNAVNGNRLNSGDSWAVIPLRVTVAGTPVDGGVNPTDAGFASDADPFATDGPLAFDSSRSMAYGQCAVRAGSSKTPAGQGLFVVVAAALAAVARRRRAS